VLRNLAPLKSYYLNQLFDVKLLRRVNSLVQPEWVMLCLNERFLCLGNIKKEFY
jgi:hypothetical protein